MRELSLSKRRIYELYWGEGLTTREAARELGCSDSTLRDWMNTYGIPLRSRHNLQTWLSVQTTVAVSLRRGIYEQYWVNEQTTGEVADSLGWSKSFIIDSMKRLSIPRRTGGIPPTDPITYHTNEEETDEEPVGEMPEDPDPSKYLASYDDFDKDRLYELYWGHGHDIRGTLARLDADISASVLRDRFDEFGIPRRDRHGTNQHRRRTWLPREGIPPKYQWPENREPRKRTEKRFATWRTPKTATGD